MNNAVCTEIEGLNPVDFRDVANSELKKIADRFSRYAKNHFDKSIAVVIYVDADATDQNMTIMLREPEEIINEGANSVED